MYICFFEWCMRKCANLLKYGTVPGTSTEHRAQSDAAANSMLGWIFGYMWMEVLKIPVGIYVIQDCNS